MPPSHDEGRPASRTPLKLSILNDTPSVPARCARCGHVVWSAVSIRTGLGLGCRRLLARTGAAA